MTSRSTAIWGSAHAHYCHCTSTMHHGSGEADILLHLGVAGYPSCDAQRRVAWRRRLRVMVHGLLQLAGTPASTPWMRRRRYSSVLHTWQNRMDQDLMQSYIWRGHSRSDAHDFEGKPCAVAFMRSCGGSACFYVVAIEQISQHSQSADSNRHFNDIVTCIHRQGSDNWHVVPNGQCEMNLRCPLVRRRKVGTREVGTMLHLRRHPAQCKRPQAHRRDPLPAPHNSAQTQQALTQLPTFILLQIGFLYLKFYLRFTNVAALSHTGPRAARAGVSFQIA